MSFLIGTLFLHETKGTDIVTASAQERAAA